MYSDTDSAERYCQRFKHGPGGGVKQLHAAVVRGELAVDGL